MLIPFCRWATEGKERGEKKRESRQRRRTMGKRTRKCRILFFKPFGSVVVFSRKKRVKKLRVKKSTKVRSTTEHLSENSKPGENRQGAFCQMLDSTHSPEPRGVCAPWSAVFLGVVHATPPRARHGSGGGVFVSVVIGSERRGVSKAARGDRTFYYFYFYFPRGHYFPLKEQKNTREKKRKKTR